ncbi:hypothetical protein DWY34_15405 [Blautia sp. AF25-12LB]|nr:hypothetical protein DWY34_15405 [Blautia sp. AF25-12LB]
MRTDSIVVSKGGIYTTSTSDTFTKQQWQDQEALHRFQLISPLLQTGLDDARRLQLRRTIADENNISVRTLYRYEKAFAEKQFAGLRPADREKRRSQILPENFEFLLEQAIQLRREVPPRSFTFWKRKVLWHLVF